jgi:pyruvate dehydrogenase E1 component
MIPIYIFYSMFGFQRTGDSIWAAADQMARGFLIGATAGRTTLTGEGLQHADGHSPLLASTNPAVVHYDPAYGYEIAHIVQGRSAPHVRRDSTRENVIYYLTVYNEPMVQPAEPEGRRRGHPRGMYLLCGRADTRAWTRTPPRAAARLRRRRAVGAGGPAAAAQTTGASSPTCGR